MEVRNQQLRVTSSWDFKPPFLVYSQVPKWQAIAIPDDVKSYAELEAWLGPTAQRFGIREASPLLFG